MSFLELVGRLRRFRIWSKARELRLALGQPIAKAFHFIVIWLGPNLIPRNLWLKHVYDYQVIYVDPQRIARLVKVGGWRWSSRSDSLLRKTLAWYRYGDGLKSVRTHLTRNLHGRFVADGDWDLYADPFETLPVITQLFEEGRLPQETDEYQRYLKRINEGRLTWARGCRNQTDLDHYYDTLVRAYEDIKANGYQTQTELGEIGVDEIRVCIDRNGGVCVYGGGTHRLSIARFLGLDLVPVSLKRVHSDWLNSIADSTSRPDENVIRWGLSTIDLQHAANPEEVKSDKERD